MELPNGRLVAAGLAKGHEPTKHRDIRNRRQFAASVRGAPFDGVTDDRAPHGEACASRGNMQATDSRLDAALRSGKNTLYRDFFPYELPCRMCHSESFFALQ